MRAAPWARALAGLLAGWTAVPALAAPQTFNTALPVATGEFIFRAQFLARRLSGDPGPAERRVTVLGGVSVLGYGVTGKLAVFGGLPYLHKSLGVTLPGGRRIARDASGFGDAKLFGRYTIFQRDAPGRTFRIAPFLGAEIPTGEDDGGDGLGRLPATLQTGSGSWDLFGGIVASYQTLDFEIDAQAGYKLNTEANDFEFGDEARLDASLQYRLMPRQLDSGVPGFLYGVVEANLIHRGRNQIGGAGDSDSGGTTLLIAPGLQYVTKRWVVEAIVQFPAVQNLRGAALEDDYTVRAGFRINF